MLKSTSISKKNETEQIHKPVLIDTLQVLDQILVFKRETINIALFPAKDVCFPNFSFMDIENFEVNNIKIKTASDLHSNECNKKLELSIDTGFSIKYSDGCHTLYQHVKHTFFVTIEKMNFPIKNTSVFTSYPSSKSMVKQDSNSLEAIAVADFFGETICPYTGALILDIGVFFIIINTKTTESLVPGYCSE